MKSLQLQNYIRAYKLNGESHGILKQAKDINIDDVLNDMKTLTFTLPFSDRLHSEQNLIFQNHRYIIKQIEETHGNRDVTAYSAFIELADRNVKKVEFQNLSFQAGAEKILSGSGWTVGTVEVLEDEQLHAMSEENQSVLFLLREFAKVGGYEIDFDTINRKINFVKSVGQETDFIFRYAKNIKEISKTEYAPEATVLYPRGKGGLTIESVNNGREYLENYSWYVEQGMSLTEARQRYKKEMVWEDERFIYAGTLMRAGQDKLAVLSRPQIAYETKVIDINAGVLQVGDYATVIDDELGIKLQVRVVRIKRYPQREWQNEIEFNYLIPGLSDGESSVGGSNESEGEKMLLVKNQSALNIGTTFSNVLEMNLTAYTNTNLQAGLAIVGQSSTKTVLHAYFAYNGQEVGIYVKQTVDGWATIGVPFLLTMIPEGSGTLALYVKVESGTFAIALNKAELFIKGENLFGGMGASLPKANVVEEVTYSSITVTDDVVVTKQTPIKRTKSEIVEYSNLTVTENINITLII